MPGYRLNVIKHSKNGDGKVLASFDDVSVDTSVGQLKKRIQAKIQMNANRQSLREGVGKENKNLKDEVKLDDLAEMRALAADKSSVKIYLKDLGPQISWTGVFLTEYAGPLIFYLFFYFRIIPQIYGLDSNSFMITPTGYVQKLAMICHTIHYAKREFETLFIHRFSNGTMPMRNIFKNSAYYWGFGAALGYYVNHPLYTAPSDSQANMWAALWAVMEFGNFSIHVALRNLRPAGSKVRKVPMPTGNPFTWLFSCTTCPNYTYEIAGWICFTLMTNCLMSGVFTLAGFMQMMVWAKGKRRNYIKEFGEKCPQVKRRAAIVPFLI